MAIGQMYQVKVFHKYDTEDMINVYYYEQVGATTGGPNDAHGLANAMIDIVFQTERLIVSNHVVFDRVEAICLSNDLDFWTELFDANTFGAVASEALPPFVAWDFKLVRETRASRNGRKRIGGVPESFQNKGVVVLGAAADAVNDHAATLGGSIASISFGGTWVPKIYRWNPEAIFGVVGCDYVKITSQNSRKFGVGS